MDHIRDEIPTPSHNLDFDDFCMILPRQQKTNPIIPGLFTSNGPKWRDPEQNQVLHPLGRRLHFRMMGARATNSLIDWLVVWNMNFTFPYIGKNHPNWLSYFSGGLKPPTSKFLKPSQPSKTAPSIVADVIDRRRSVEQRPTGLGKSWSCEVPGWKILM